MLLICGSYFWFGAVFYKFNLQRYFSISTVVIAVVIMISLELWPEALSVCAYLLLPMVVLAFGLAYSPTLNWLTRSGDYSYGIYIYAFPIQQSIIYLYPHMTLKLYLLICLILTLMCAILSWHFIERPALAFKPSKLSASQ